MSVNATSAPDASDRNWKRSAVAGAGIGLLLALYRSGSVTERELGFAFWILVASLAVMAVVFRRGCRALLARPELVVPVGIVLPLDVVLTWLADAPKLKAVMNPIASLALWGIGIAVSFPFATTIALWTMFAAWQTDLLIRAQSNPGPLDLAPWAPIRRGFWRAFGAWSSAPAACNSSLYRWSRSLDGAGSRVSFSACWRSPCSGMSRPSRSCPG